jgi:hypothetical protein
MSQRVSENCCNDSCQYAMSGADAGVDECGSEPAAHYGPTRSRSRGSVRDEIERIQTTTDRVRCWTTRGRDSVECIRRTLRSFPCVASIATVELLRVVR